MDLFAGIYSTVFIYLLAFVSPPKCFAFHYIIPLGFCFFLGHFSVQIPDHRSQAHFFFLCFLTYNHLCVTGFISADSQGNIYKEKYIQCWIADWQNNHPHAFRFEHLTEQLSEMMKKITKYSKVIKQLSWTFLCIFTFLFTVMTDGFGLG